MCIDDLAGFVRRRWCAGNTVDAGRDADTGCGIDANAAAERRNKHAAGIAVSDVV
jgi:hypothetical protein